MYHLPRTTVPTHTEADEWREEVAGAWCVRCQALAWVARGGVAPWNLTRHEARGSQAGRQHLATNRYTYSVIRAIDGLL